MKRRYSFDVLKFVFSIMIALYHFGVYIPGVSYAVQFFFMISGYFLGRKIYVNRGRLPGNTQRRMYAPCILSISLA